MNVLVWFKRDLRVVDHPALAAAAGCRVLPLFIVEPAYWQLADVSGRHWAFTAECLMSLRQELHALEAPLVIRVGEAVDCLQRLVKTHRLGRIISHEETGNQWTYARDQRVAAWASHAGIEWIQLPQSGVVRRLASRNGWAARRDRFISAPVATVAALSAIPGVEPGQIPSARALRLPEDRCPHRQTGGRLQADHALDGFLLRRGERYRSAMASPILGEQACSRLSPYLAMGVISIREVAQAAAARLAEKPGGQWTGSLSSFASRLAWRDHFIQKLEDDPLIEHRCFHPAYQGLWPGVSDPIRLAAWQTGQTGVPFVDACMRYLAATGWLNFRMRAMLMSFASHHLWLDWRATGQHLARLFTDYEPGIHWSQCQMQSGTTGINTVRIYNPVKQGLEHDPAGHFTRNWLPELAAVPDQYLHQPWKWPGASGLLGRKYPEPVIDLTAAARSARALVWGVREQPGFAHAARLVASKHASQPDARFVNDRAPRMVRPKPPVPGQLGFDF